MTRRTIRLLVAVAAVAAAAACAAAAVGADGPKEPLPDSVGTLVPARVTVDAPPNVFVARTAQLAPDSAGGWATGATPVWTLTDSSVAAVSPLGVVVGRKPGSTVVRATGSGKPATAEVTVVPPDDSEVVVIAHRGYMAVYPENTLVAINGALDIGADGVEFDVRLSRDDVPMIMHDETVDRTTNGSGKVRDLTYAQLAALNACAKAPTRWPPCALPSFADVLTAVRGRGTLLVHLYGPYTAVDLKRMLDMLRAAKMDRRAVFLCFDLPTLKLLRQVDPIVPLGVLSATVPVLDTVASLGRAAAIPDVRPMLAAAAQGSDVLRAARRRGLDNATYTITSQAQAEAAVKLGFRRLISDLPLDRSRLLP